MSTNQHQQNSKKKVKPTTVSETMAMSGSKGNREAQAKAGGGRSETKNTRRANEEEKLEAMVESRVKERTVGLEMALRQVAEREREEDHARFQEQYKRELRSEFDEKLAKQVDLWGKVYCVARKKGSGGGNCATAAQQANSQQHRQACGGTFAPIFSIAAERSGQHHQAGGDSVSCKGVQGIQTSARKRERLAFYVSPSSWQCLVCGSNVARKKAQRDVDSAKRY